MAYNKVHPDGWHNAPNNTTPITADAMNTIENGIADAAVAVDVSGAYGPGGTAGNIGTTQGDVRYARRTRAALGVDVTASPFNADPTGAASARAAWDAAAAFAVSSGLNTIYLPEGTYLAVPDATTGVCFSIPAGIKRIVGAGRDRTILRVQAGVGDYVAVIGSASGADVSGIVLEDFTIDQNNTNNPVTTGFTLSSPFFTGKARFCISIKYSTTTTTIRRVRCVDMDNVNAFSINGPARDILIENNAFELSSSIAADHDHSTLYVNSASTGSVVRIIGNTADAPNSEAGHNGARTFIETHSGYQIIRDNISRGFQKGGNVSGQSLISGEGSRWENNNFIDCLFGIEVWSSTYSTNTGPVGLKGAIVRGNRIQLDLTKWGAWNGGTFGGYGIFLDRGSNLPVHDLTIVDNHIIFKKGTYVGQAGDVASMGIVWRRTTPGTIVDRRVTITRNTIDGALAGGMQFWTLGDFFMVVDNIVKNCGQATVAAGGAISNGLAVGIIVQNGSYTNSAFDRNQILDDQAKPTTNNGFYLYPSAPCTNSTCNDNVITAANAGKIVAASSATGFSIRMTQTGKLISTNAPLSASADTVTVVGHGLANGAAVQLSGVLTATGVTAATPYFVVGAATDSFQLALTPGGSAVDITADGTACVIVSAVSLPTGWSAYGSTIVDRTNGITYTQTTAPEGSTWTVASLVETSPEVLAGTTGSVAVSYDRRLAVSAATIAALTSGTCTAVLIPVSKKVTASSVRIVTGTTAAVSPTHQWAALTDLSGNVLAVTADATTAALGASTQFTWNFTAPVVLPAGRYYLHVMIAATTVPTLLGCSTSAAATKYAPIITGPGSTGQTAPPSVGGTLTVPSTTGTGPGYLELA